MTKKFQISLVSLLAIAMFAVTAAAAQAEEKTYVSNASNSLCVNPTEAGFAPEIGGERNYAGLTTEHAGAFPDTGTACGSNAPIHPTAMAGPGEKAFPYNGAIPGASWVSINAAGSDTSNPPPAYYIYDATFRLCANQVGTAEVTVHMFADNTAGSFLNGRPIGNLGFNLGATNHENFDQESTTPHGPVGGWPFGPKVGAAGGFQTGTNTLQFVVYDESGGNTGVDFSAVVTAPPCEVTQKVVSDESNSLCVDPTEKAFVPVINGKDNFKPLTKEHNGPFPETGTACAPETASHPTAMGGPGEKAFPYNGAIPEASWVSINKAGEDTANPPPKYYIYDAEFTLCQNQAAHSEIKLHMFADNTAGAFLNGAPIGHLGSNLGATNHENFDQESTTPHGPIGGWPFTASGPFKAGVNTLQFVVYDESGSFTGLDFSAVITSSVECEEPEFPGLGRCVKVHTGRGDYKDAGCEKGQFANGSFEWEPGTIKNKFVSKEELTFFEGRTSKSKVTCKGSTDVGEYVGDNPETPGESEDLETFTFTGCETAGLKCTSVGASEGEIHSTLLRSLYGFIKKPVEGTKYVLGVSLAPASGTVWAEFDCGGKVAHIVIRGAVISSITPISKMTTTFKETFAEAAGIQKYQHFEGQPNEFLETSTNGGAFEQTGFSSLDTITNEEALDLREVI